MWAGGGWRVADGGWRMAAYFGPQAAASGSGYDEVQGDVHLKGRPLGQCVLHDVVQTERRKQAPDPVKPDRKGKQPTNLAV